MPAFNSKTRGDSKSPGWKRELWDRIHDPMQLRMLLTGLVLLFSYVGVELILNSKVIEAARRLRSEQHRLELIRDVEQLRTDYFLFADRLLRTHRSTITPDKGSTIISEKKPDGRSSTVRSAVAENGVNNPDEWTRYIMSGVRKCPVQLILLDSETPRKCGPYKGAVVRIALEGTYTEVTKFLNWLDNNEKLVRVDRILMEPLKNNALLNVQLTVVGVME